MSEIYWVKQFFVKLLLILSISIISCWVYSKPGWDSISAFILALSTFFAFDFQYSTKKENKHDVDLYKKFLEILPTNGTISYLRDTDMSLPIDTDVINPLGYFATIWRNAEYEFKDKKIEKIKLEFINSIDEFMSKFTINTFSTHMGKNAIPIEWSEDNPSRYNDVRDLLNDLAYKVVINHAELIRIEKKWLL